MLELFEVESFEVCDIFKDCFIISGMAVLTPLLVELLVVPSVVEELMVNVKLYDEESKLESVSVRVTVTE